MSEWKDLNQDQKLLELKRQKAVLNMEAEFSYNDKQLLLDRAGEIIKALNGQKFSPKEIEEDIGISEFALLIECKKAGYQESKDTRDLVPKQYVNHIYELSPVAKSEKVVSDLRAEIEDLKAENIKLNKKLKKLSVGVKPRLK